jgi:hypothetical protein
MKDAGAAGTLHQSFPKGVSVGSQRHAVRPRRENALQCLS